jgi:hypothetical protein
MGGIEMCAYEYDNYEEQENYVKVRERKAKRAERKRKRRMQKIMGLVMILCSVVAFSMQDPDSGTVGVTCLALGLFLALTREDVLL